MNGAGRSLELIRCETNKGLIEKHNDTYVIQLYPNIAETFGANKSFYICFD